MRAGEIPSILRRQAKAGNGIKSTDSVVLIRVLLGVCAALSLFAYNMHKHGRVHFLGPADDRFKLVNIMSVNGAEVIYAHRVEHIRRQYRLFESFFELMACVINAVHSADSLPVPPLEVDIPGLYAFF